MGVAHFREHTLPVQLDARCITGPLEAEKLIKMFLNGVDFYFRFAVMRVSIFYKMVTSLFWAKKVSASLIQTKVRPWVGGDLLQKL